MTRMDPTMFDVAPPTILDFGPGDRIHNPTGLGDHDFLTIVRIGRPDRGNLVRVWTRQYLLPIRVAADDGIHPFTLADQAMIDGLVEAEQTRLGLPHRRPGRPPLMRRVRVRGLGRRTGHRP